MAVGDQVGDLLGQDPIAEYLAKLNVWENLHVSNNVAQVQLSVLF